MLREGMLVIRANVLSNYFVPGIILCSSHNPDKCPMKQGQVSYEASSFILSIYKGERGDSEWLANLPTDTESGAQLEPGNLTEEHSE